MKFRRVAVAGSLLMLFISIAGFIVTMVLNAFVLDHYDAYGEVPIPGSAQLHLPAGEATVSFHTQVIGSPSGGGLPIPPLSMNIDPPDGVADPQVTEKFSGTTTVNNDSRRQVWLVQIPVEGTYTITTQGQVSGFINPRLAFGHDSSMGYLVWVFVGLFVIAVVSLVGTLWRSKRTPAVVASAPFPPVFAPAPVQPVQPAEPTGEGVRIEQLRHIAALRDSGALTEAEFEAEKRRILDGI